VSERVVRVVGEQDRYEFWWVCDDCVEESEHCTTPMDAYGLALRHAAWAHHGDAVGWGGTPHVSDFDRELVPEPDLITGKPVLDPDWAAVAEEDLYRLYQKTKPWIHRLAGWLGRI
jgi:hypothetical protein